MSDDSKIVAGDKIEMFTEEERIYKTMVWEVLFDGAILVALPEYQGVPMLIHADDDVYVIYFRQSGRYMIQAKAKGVVTKDGVRYARLVQTTKPIKSQRRDYYRLPVKLKVRVCLYSTKGVVRLGGLSDYMDLDEITEMETTETRDLSVTGVSINTKREYTVGDKYMLQIFIDDAGGDMKELEMYAEVVRIFFEPETMLYKVGMRFLKQNSSTSEFLAKYVLIRQQKQIMRRRLIEGDLK